MTEIFNGLKGLLFAYSTALLLVIVAVTQSDQSQYEKALQSLREVQILSATIDPKFLASLIESDTQGLEEAGQSTFNIVEIDRIISFHYPKASVDYSTIPKAFVGNLPGGFDFGRGQVDAFPENFTGLIGFNYIGRPMTKPTTLERYIELHNASLSPVTYTRMRPDFASPGRLEAYRVETREFNTAENLQRNDNGAGHVIDGFNLRQVQPSGSPRQCNLTPRRTSINSNLVYFCDLGLFEFDGTQFSGVRLLIPALVEFQSIQLGKAANFIQIPTGRQVDFKVAHPELATLAEPYPYLTFEDLKTVLETERDRTPSTVSLFGAEINLDLVVKFILSSLVLFFFYINLQIREARRISAMTTQKDKSTWLPTYPGFENTAVVALQLFALPVAVIWVFIQRGAVQQGPFIWLSFLLQLAFAIWCFVEIVKLRTAIHKDA